MTPQEARMNVEMRLLKAGISHSGEQIFATMEELVAMRISQPWADFRDLGDTRAFCNVCGVPDNFILTPFFINVCQSCTHKAMKLVRAHWEAKP